MLQIKSEVEKLEQLYTFRDKARVLSFLEQQPNLLALLLEAPTHIRQYFPDNELILEEVIDVEDPNSRDLWVKISTEDFSDAFFAKLDSLIEHWWIDAADEKKLSIWKLV